MNEKIKASEVDLTGLDGEALGVVATSEALAMARRLKVDLVCTSLFASPPPCRLVGAGTARQEREQERKQARAPKVKEIRLTPQIEDHDYDTKKRQAERTLTSGDSVLLVFHIKGKEGPKAKELLKGLLQELQPLGRKKAGIHMSGKEVSVQVDPVQQQ